jgi:hypothetical protein
MTDKSSTALTGLRVYPILLALLAAALFGAIAPAGKALLGDISPLPLAGLLYLAFRRGSWACFIAVLIADSVGSVGIDVAKPGARGYRAAGMADIS